MLPAPTPFPEVNGQRPIGQARLEYCNVSRKLLAQPSSHGPGPQDATSSRDKRA